MAYRLCVIAVALTVCFYASLFKRPGIWTRVGGRDYLYGYPWEVTGIGGDTRESLFDLEYGDFKNLTLNMLFRGVPMGAGTISLIVIHNRRRPHSLMSRGLCPNCRYDLRGSTGRPNGPECGRELEWFAENDETVINHASQNQA